MSNVSEKYIQKFPRHVGVTVDVCWSCVDPSVVNRGFQQVFVMKCFSSAGGHIELLAVDKLLMCLCFGKQIQRGWLENIAGMCKQHNCRGWVGLVRRPESESGEISPNSFKRRWDWVVFRLAWGYRAKFIGKCTGLVRIPSGVG